MNNAAAVLQNVPTEPLTRARVLVVEDNAKQREVIARSLHDRYECVPVGDAEAARRALAAGDFELIVCDLKLPGESGLDLLRELPSLKPDAAVIIVTGTDDQQTAEAAIGFGAYGYLIKPFRRVELMVNISNALRRRSLEQAQRNYTGELEGRLLERTSALNSALTELETARLETLSRLSLAVEARDRVTAEHVDGMVKVVERFARKLGYTDLEAHELGTASTMHDVGKIGVPDEILLKPGGLTPDERAQMEQHAEIGYRMLAGSSNPLLQLGAEIAWTHHERWDGTGYPRGLAGEAIPRSARIVQIVDAYSAMMTDRPYRDALPLDIAKRQLADGSGTQFDPEMTGLFLGDFDDICR